MPPNCLSSRENLLKEKLSSNQISVEEYFFLVSQDLRAAELNLDVLEDCMGQRVYLFENQNENPMRNLSSAQIYKADKMRRTQDSLRDSQEGESGLESQSPALVPHHVVSSTLGISSKHTTCTIPPHTTCSTPHACTLNATLVSSCNTSSSSLQSLPLPLPCRALPFYPPGSAM